MTLREWLSMQMDNLMATVFIAVVVAALVGFYRRSTGMAVFVACWASSVLAVLGYLVGNAWGYDWRVLVPALGVGSGFCGVAFFKIAMKFSERLEAQDAEIGKRLADKAVGRLEGLMPGGDK